QWNDPLRFGQGIISSCEHRPGSADVTRRKEPAAPARVLSIHAHPDDQEFTVAGTLAKWVHAGSRIVTVCLTSGEAGSNRFTPPDHRAAADVTLDAVFPSAETRFIFPELLAEGLEPHHVREVWLVGSEHADTFVDIAAVLDIKIGALREHRSQMGDWDPSAMIR